MAFDIKRLGSHLAGSDDGNEGGETLLLRTNEHRTYRSLKGPDKMPFSIYDPQGHHGLYVAREACIVVGFECAWVAAETSATTCNAQLERLQGTEASTQGDALLAATAVNVKGAAQTVHEPDIVTTSGRNVLAAGDRLNLHFALDDGSAVTPNQLADFYGCVHVVPVELPEASN